MIADYELSLLAKEKGFDEETRDYYNSDGDLIMCNGDEYFINSCFSIKFPLMCVAPTHEEIHKWLRTKNIEFKLTPIKIGTERHYMIQVWNGIISIEEIHKIYDHAWNRILTKTLEQL